MIVGALVFALALHPVVGCLADSSAPGGWHWEWERVLLQCREGAARIAGEEAYREMDKICHANATQVVADRWTRLYGMDPAQWNWQLLCGSLGE